VIKVPHRLWGVPTAGLAPCGPCGRLVPVQNCPHWKFISRSKLPPEPEAVARAARKLTEQDVSFIRANRHLPRARLCDMLGIGRRTLSDVLSGRTWKDVQ